MPKVILVTGLEVSCPSLEVLEQALSLNQFLLTDAKVSDSDFLVTLWIMSIGSRASDSLLQVGGFVDEWASQVDYLQFLAEEYLMTAAGNKTDSEVHVVLRASDTHLSLC